MQIVVLDTTKVQIFKQITTRFEEWSCQPQLFQIPQRYRFSSKSQRYDASTLLSTCCFRYHKGTDFQANHNSFFFFCFFSFVVLDTTKVQIFKQITTSMWWKAVEKTLFQIPQRYRFSSKSQPWQVNTLISGSCFRYHKGTDFQANHNIGCHMNLMSQLFQIPQRYRFSSKSQHEFQQFLF